MAFSPLSMTSSIQFVQIIAVTASVLFVTTNAIDQQECPDGTGDYQELRKEQCTRYDSEPFSGQLYTWKPYLDVANKCQLFCSATGSDGERLYHKFADNVINGTPCDRTGNSVCVDGACLPIWCDGSVGGKGKKNDACLECGGDGKDCVTEHGNIDTQQMTLGYNELFIVPEGATSILVREDAPSNNYIAVRDNDGNYYLNGDGEIALYPESVEMAGTVFEYQRHNTGIEYLSAEGPLQQALIFELVKRSAQGAPVSYEYSLKEALPDSYAWVASAWTSCNASCGDGWMNRDVRCISAGTGDVVDDSHCLPDTKLKSTQFCNHGNCTGSWKAGEWSSCSAACGTGIETRTVGCEERYGDAESVDTEMCDEKLRPEHIRQCDTEIPCHLWSTGPWSKCSQECGAGEQTRQVRCSAQHNDTHSISGALPDNYCDVRIRPPERQACNEGPCNGAEWLTSGWSGCQCSGTETRVVLCINKDGHVLHNDQCDLSTQPSTTQHCTPAHDDPSCTKISRHWFTSQWSKCSAKCGQGSQQRHVFCGSLIDDVITVLPSSDCIADEQPAAKQECSVHDCVGEWFAAPFGKCSAACGGGKRHRTLMCYIGNKLAGESDCENGARPYATEDCNVQPCDDDHLIVVNPKGCRDSPHGCCSDGVTAAEGPDNLGCLASNDPIPDGTCIETEYGCCPDGVTVAQGPLFKGCETHSCRDSRYGCCPDGETPATGEDNDGCAEAEEDLIVPVTIQKLGDGETHTLPTEAPEVIEDLIVPVTFQKLGDGEARTLPTEAPEVEEELIVAVTHRNLGDGELCFESAYGCCADKKTLKQGPNGEGCSEYQQVEEEGSGEVEDIIPPPRHVDVEGDVHPSFPPSTDDGSESSGEPECQSSQFGCCSDGVTSARGPDGSGCEVNIELEPESGCARSTYGCCIDGVTAASGPQFAGCRSESDRNYEPSCKDEPYGCCPDGHSAAVGPEYAGCRHRIDAAAVCSLPKEKGSCANLTIQWYYDGAYGDCQRFWYSGCEGNENRFDSREKCRNQCISPPEDSFQRCFLPRTGGRCRDTRYRYYYNHEQSQCEEFIYGGCLGNDNNFDTIDQCQNTCIEPLKPNICRQPAQRGPCGGSYKRWYFDYERDSCEPFVYGGCLGNDNRFDSLEECEGRCVAAAVQICSLEKDPGPCDATFYRWHFDIATGQCQEFVFGGCRGNANKFLTRSECEHTCAKLIQRKTINPCGMLPDTGKCKAHYQRWYFDRSDGFCKQFVYGGCGGNENRFDSEPHCRETCNAHTPVDVCLVPAEVTTQCSAESSMYHFDSHIGQCVEFATGTCALNANQFDSMESCRKTCAAHISSPVSDIPTNERCLLPRDPGPCLAAMIRWHYSAMDGRCVRFEYGGCGGNKNRFLTEEICNTECQPATTTPLPTTSQAPTIPSIPEDNIDDTEIDTDYETETKSPTDEESGAEDITTDICRLTPETGPCTTFLHQWYFNTASQSCKQFLYGGCGGNENRFETKEDCDSRCQREDVCALSPAVGSCAAQITMYYYDRATDRCLQFVYGGCGGNDNRFETREACEQRCHVRKPSVTGLAICSELADRGPCRASETKWHYDKETGECMEFTYGGCDGNTNRFDSKEQCQQSCPLTSICQLPADVGPCRASKPRYFYDASIGDCQQFTYGGCSGNANRFLTIENCRKVCNGVQAAEEVVTSPSVDEEADVCSLKEDTGPCADYQLLWHFDSESQACRQFWYGGCEGNGNKFETEEQCLSRCVITESSTNPETDVVTEKPTVAVDVPSTATEPTETKDLCLLAQDTGSCGEYQLLWYFESESQACRQFWYGGCGGNENRFENEEQCNARCVAFTTTSAPEVHATEPSTVAVEIPSETTDKAEDETDQNACALQKDEGEYCTGWELFWYFDNDEGECRVFYYGGCAGNDNRFPSEEDCVKQCLSPKKPTEAPEPETPSDIEITTTEAPVRDETDDDYDICTLPATAGPCTDHIVKWYWDQSRERCDRFMYGGCEGNDNNFDSEDDCNAACGSGQTPPDRSLESQDESPVIVEQDDIINSVVGETVILPCLTRGSPKPVVSWLRNGQPITERRMSTTPDGSLHIMDAGSLDSATYTCRALNNAGSASHDYTLVVNVPGMIEDSDTTGDVLASVDDTVVLPCLVTGSPMPTVRWSRNGVDIEVVGPHLHQLDTGLQIQGVRPEDAGGYVCEAWNGFGEPQRKQIIVRVEETVTATVESANETNSYVIGQTIVLVCSSNVDSAEIKWMKDDQLLRPIGSRITFADGGQLVIASVTKGDSGQYSCTAKTERQSATSSAIAIQVQVAPVWRATTPKPEALCVDKPWYANCQLIVEADMCNHAYFSVFCCKSCRDAGKLP